MENARSLVRNHSLIMEDIIRLQRELAVAQQVTCTQRLSDRNCVELVMKLQTLNLVDLIFTRSGKEYLTPSQLLLEIQDELLTHGGRVNLTELPDILNVSLTYIEAALVKITADPTVRLIRGELVTDDYLTSLIDDINDALSISDTGVDSLAAVATRYALPVDIVRETLQLHSERLQAEFDPASGSITSAAAVTQHYAAARGALRAATSVTLLADVAKDIGAPIAMVNVVACEMLEAGNLSGKVEGRGTRAAFVPSVFASAVVRSIASQFTASGFVPLDTFARLHVSDVSAFSQEHLDGSAVLPNCVVGSLLIEPISSSAAEAVSTGSWIDVLTSLPPSFPESDLPALIERIVDVMANDCALPNNAISKPETDVKQSKVKRKGRSKSTTKQSRSPDIHILAYRFIVAPALLEHVRTCVITDAELRANARAKKLADLVETVGTPIEIVQSSPAEPTNDSDREHVQRVKGRGRRRARGKDKGTKPDASNLDSDSKSGEIPIDVPDNAALTEIILANEACAHAIHTNFLDSSTEGELMITALVDEMYSEDSVHKLYNSKAHEAVQSLEREKIAARMTAEKSILTGLLHAELYDKCAGSLPSEELMNASRNWVLDSTCIDVACRVVSIVAQDNGVVVAGLGQTHELETKKKKIDTLRDICSKLAPTVQTKLKELIDIVCGKSYGSIKLFVEQYDSTAAVLNLPERRPLDKKSERATLNILRMELVQRLEDAETLPPSKLVKIATILTHSKGNGGTIVDFNSDNVTLFARAVEDMEFDTKICSALRELRDVAFKEDGHVEGKVTKSEWGDVVEKLNNFRNLFQ